VACAAKLPPNSRFAFVPAVCLCLSADGLSWFQDVETTVQTLQLLGLAAAAVASSGKVIFANESFKAEGVPWTIRAGNTIAVFDAVANERLQQALAGISRQSNVQSIPLNHNPGIVRHVLHVLPVRQQNLDGTENVFAILAIMSASFKGGSLALLQSLFNLTPAEAALAQRIGMGQSVEEIAQSHGRSVHTLRSQLKSVLAKTGCSRQAELAYILTSLVPPAD
jgi:DNA-binding CsgD family transcriptional regulator